MFHKKLHVPAKAMLFGEYAVLQNFPAVAITFYHYSFQINVNIKKSFHMKENKVFIKSSFSSYGTFFDQLLHPWLNLLVGYDVEIEILQSFPPSLGFGSSSAIIAGVSLALYEFFYDHKNIVEEAEFWKYVRKSIVCVQGKGSGYDVGVQLASIFNSNKNVDCWSFENNQPVPVLKKLNVPYNLLKHYGCFLKTNIYSDTKKMLSTQKNNFAQQHGELSLHFLKNYSLQNIEELMYKSLSI
ncbi:MAG: hypothetical protein V4591_07990, partial [Bdellovibrionota bacterium]